MWLASIGTVVCARRIRDEMNLGDHAMLLGFLLLWASMRRCQRGDNDELVDWDPPASVLPVLERAINGNAAGSAQFTLQRFRRTTEIWRMPSRSKHWGYPPRP